MATITVPAGTRTNLTTTAMNSLASATYVSCGTINISAVDPVALVVEIEATPGTVSSDKGVYLFGRVSFDNTNFSSGPVSGTTTTDEPDLYFLGFLPCNTNSALQRKSFEVLSAIGFIPPYLEIVVKNATGAALAASGHAINYTSYTGLSA